MTFMTILRGIIFATLLALLGVALYVAWRRIQHDGLLYGTEVDRAKVETERLRLAASTVALNDGKILFNGEVYWNIETGERSAAGNMFRLFYDDMQAHQRHIEGLIAGMQVALPAPQVDAILGTALASPGNSLPAFVSARDLFEQSTPTLDNIPLGLTLNAQGQQEVVTQRLEDMMHTLFIGRTNRGKSNGLLALLAALVVSEEPFWVLGIDVSGSKLNMLSIWDRMLYPVAKNVDAATIILTVVIGKEIKRRQELYEQVPEADSLSAYNQYKSPGMPTLEHGLLIVDEATLLLLEPGVGKVLARVILGMRQYGLYAMLTAHSAKAVIFDTVLRPSCPTRIVYDTEERGMKIALEVSKLDHPLPAVRGRAFVRLTEGYPDIVEMQSPCIAPTQFRELLNKHGQCGSPANRHLPLAGDKHAEHLAIVAEMLAAGAPHSEMELAVTNQENSGGAAYHYVERLKKELEIENAI